MRRRILDSSLLKGAVICIAFFCLLWIEEARVSTLEKKLAWASFAVNAAFDELETLKKVSPQPKFQTEFGMTITSYTSLRRLTDDTPWITASGTTCSPRTLAVSRDLLQGYTENAPFAYGDTAYIVIGPYIIEDTMARRKNKCADIWMPTLEAAETFGIERNAALLVTKG